MLSSTTITLACLLAAWLLRDQSAVDLLERARATLDEQLAERRESVAWAASTSSSSPWSRWSSAIRHLAEARRIDRLATRYS